MIVSLHAAQQRVEKPLQQRQRIERGIEPALMAAITARYWAYISRRAVAKRSRDCVLPPAAQTSSVSGNHSRFSAMNRAAASARAYRRADAEASSLSAPE
ncbi:MAG: hypothetical protein P8090_08085 [Gammaproteobacteria bacterium]